MKDNEERDDAEGIEGDEEEGGPEEKIREEERSQSTSDQKNPREKPHHRFLLPRVAIGIPVKIKIAPATP